VFVIIYDLLEAFHLSDKQIFYTYKNALKNSNNVYPPYQYQKFINNKCSYYKYLADKDIAVAPTFCITKEKWFSKSPEKYVDNLLSKVKTKKWDSIIAKPVYGQEAIGFAKFEKKLSTYLEKNVPKYKSIVIQEYIPGFDKNKPEIRTYFINGKFVYSIVTSQTVIAQPAQEGGTYKKLSDEEYAHILKLAKHTMESLPKLDLKGKHKHPILTRIDIGSGIEDEKVPFGMFVNEVEFVPSLYIEDHSYPAIQEIAKSFVDVAKEYKHDHQKHERINVIF
jgi:glutathione synthase/RimK-type ligase-like ATP-grasp enzyme